ncbi:MAG: VOC family protein [Candidatus Rokubacteria bacterium]|nr:VOC family protein [Candidatus Rokubacteria bacterium]
MKTVAFDHIALAAPRMADAGAVLTGVLGGTPDYGSPSGAYTFGQWRFDDGSRIEVLEPRGEGGFLRRFLEERGPGIHHVTFKVPSLPEARARAERHGYEVVGYNDSNPQWSEAFLHPRQALGIVVQFASSSGGEVPRRWQPPQGPAHPPPPVTIVGLRLCARSRERARIQWESVCLGRCAEGAGGELIFRWAGSPMRITVEIDPAREEGPLRIEIASERAVALPEGPHPVLGAVFARLAPGAVERTA